MNSTTKFTPAMLNRFCATDYRLYIIITEYRLLTVANIDKQGIASRLWFAVHVQ